MKFGIWQPIFGGWLRNIENENMPATFEYTKKVAQAADRLGFHITLIAELYLNDIKGQEESSMEAWTTTAAIAAVTENIQLLTALRPGYHNPAITAKMISNIDNISGGRFNINLVSAWWEEEARQYGGTFTAHDERYERTSEFIEVIRGLWSQTPFSYKGKFYDLQDTYMEPKPQRQPTIFAGGESPKGKQTIVDHCDAYVMHGGTVEEIKTKIQEMKDLRAVAGKESLQSFGMAAYVIARDTEEEVEVELARITDVKDAAGYVGFKDFTTKSKLEQEIALRDYSVSNRGLRPELFGTPDQIEKKLKEYEEVGLDFVLLQFSPQLEEMEYFAKNIMSKF